MQHSFFNRVTGRVCGALALAAVSSVAWADPQDVAEDQKAAVATAAVATVAVQAVQDAAVQDAAVQDAAVRDTGVQQAGANAASTTDGLGFGAPAAVTQLEESRGGTDVHNDMKLDGVVTGNSAVNVATGSNTIDSGAFANMSGIPVVIQNSGANVLIQSATIVNLQFK
jgi:hypothetical protein